MEPNQQEVAAKCRLVLDSVQQATVNRSQDISVPELESKCVNSVEQLSQLVDAHSDLFKACKRRNLGEDGDELYNQARQRSEALNSLMQQLDVLAESLADALEDLASSTAHPHVNTPNPQEVIQYAHLIRYTTFAHMGLVSAPPGPQEPQMVNSQLFQFARDHQARMAMQPPMQAAPSMPQGADGAAFPPGYQFPPGLAQPPAGYQPGDTVVMPPADGAAAGAGAGAAGPAGPAPQVLPPRPPAPPETGGGMALDLILNPDMEDVEDWSSDDEDSDY